MARRDLQADLELCNKAIPGLQNVFTEWDGKVVLGFGVPGEHVHQLSENEYSLITQACEGWLHAIKRALETESTLRKLVEALERSPHYATKETLTLFEWAMRENELERVYAEAKEVLGDGN